MEYHKVHIATAMWWISLACYVLSFLLPVSAEREIGITTRNVLGLEVFFLSLNPAVSTYSEDYRCAFAWLANVTWVIAAVSYSRSTELSLCVGIIGAFLGSLFLNETHLLIGYYVWVASMYLMLVAAGLRLRSRS